jgi:hypothetical protein
MLARNPAYLSQGLRPRTPALYLIESGVFFMVGF